MSPRTLVLRRPLGGLRDVSALSAVLDTGDVIALNQLVKHVAAPQLSHRVNTWAALIRSGVWTNLVGAKIEDTWGLVCLCVCACVYVRVWFIKVGSITISQTFFHHIWCFSIDRTWTEGDTKNSRKKATEKIAAERLTIKKINYFLPFLLHGLRNLISWEYKSLNQSFSLFFLDG